MRDSQFMRIIASAMLTTFGDWDRAEARLRGLLDEIGGEAPGYVGSYAKNWLAYVLLCRGDTAAAEATARSVIEQLRGSARMQAHALHVLAAAALRQGRPEEALQHADRSLSVSTNDGFRAVSVALRAAALDALDRRDEACSVSREAVALYTARSHGEMFGTWLGHLAGEVLFAAGDAGAARRAVELGLDELARCASASKPARDALVATAFPEGPLIVLARKLGIDLSARLPDVTRWS